MFSIFRRNKKKKEEALKTKQASPSIATGYVSPSSYSSSSSRSIADDVMANPLHPLNPLNPVYNSFVDSTPSPSYSSDDSCRYVSSSNDNSSSYSSSYDSCSSSSYDSGSSSYDSGSSSSYSSD